MNQRTHRRPHPMAVLPFAMRVEFMWDLIRKRTPGLEQLAVDRIAERFKNDDDPERQAALDALRAKVDAL